MASIMIIDDNADTCEPLARFLKKAGHDVTCLGNGKDALAAVIAKPPEVMVLDLCMPEMDGPSFLEVVRSYLRLQSLPVVVLTGLAESPMIERIRCLKVNSILVKAKATLDDVQKAVEEALVRVPN
jgi:CheY-like chemotaxis protein